MTKKRTKNEKQKNQGAGTTQGRAIVSAEETFSYYTYGTEDACPHRLAFGILSEHDAIINCA